MRKFLASLLTVIFLVSGIVGFSANSASASTGTEEFVARMYRTCLSREPEAGGLAFWVNQLDSHESTGAAVAAHFIFSIELNNQNLDNPGFLNVMYAAFFGRVPDEGGFNFWLNKMNNEGKTRSEIFEYFVNSPEFANICRQFGIVRGDYLLDYPVEITAKVNIFVDRLYSYILDRPCDDAGLTYWTKRFLNGQETGAHAAAGFFFSNEYTERNRTDEEFISDLYNAMLGRDPDQAGLDYWDKFFDYGHSREYLFNSFLVSAEFAEICDAYEIRRGNTIPVQPGEENIVNTDATYNGNRVYRYEVEGYGTVYGYFVDTTDFNNRVAARRTELGLATDFFDDDYVRIRAMECTVEFGHDRPNGQFWFDASQNNNFTEIMTQQTDGRSAFLSFMGSGPHKQIIEYSYPHFTSAAFVRVQPTADGQWEFVFESTCAHSRP